MNAVFIWTGAAFLYNPLFWLDQHVFYHHTHTNEPAADIDLYWTNAGA